MEPMALGVRARRAAQYASFRSSKVRVKDLAQDRVPPQRTRFHHRFPRLHDQRPRHRDHRRQSCPKQSARDPHLWPASMPAGPAHSLPRDLKGHISDDAQQDVPVLAQGTDLDASDARTPLTRNLGRNAI